MPKPKNRSKKSFSFSKLHTRAWGSNLCAAEFPHYNSDPVKRFSRGLNTSEMWNTFTHIDTCAVDRAYNSPHWRQDPVQVLAGGTPANEIRKFTMMAAFIAIMFMMMMKNHDDDEESWWWWRIMMMMKNHVDDTTDNAPNLISWCVQDEGIVEGWTLRVVLTLGGSWGMEPGLEVAYINQHVYHHHYRHHYHHY